MSKQWSYSLAPQCGTGTMRCGCCGKQIESGEFRYRQKSSKGDWHYVQQHRACSLDDPTWLERDKAQADAIAHQARFVAACIAFRKEWEINDLDDYIGEAA